MDNDIIQNRLVSGQYINALACIYGYNYIYVPVYVTTYISLYASMIIRETLSYHVNGIPF